MNLFNLSIKRRLLLLAAIAVVGLIFVGVMVASGMANLQHLQSSDTQLSNINSGMLTLRRHEKDFLARKDDKYVERFNNALKQNLADVKALSTELDIAGLDHTDLDKMGGHLTEYGSRFNTVVELQREIGYDPKSGLYGALRSTVHSVEEKLSDAPELKASMLMLRRHEKDFMLRRDTKYLARFNNEVENFTALSSAFMGADESDAINRSINSYASQFKSLVSAEKNIGLGPNSGALGELRATVHEAEKLFKGLKSQLNTTIAASTKSNQQFLIGAIAIVGLVITVLALLVAFSIFKPLETFTEEITNIITDKDLSVRLTVSGNDEITAVATAFNSLLEALHEMIGKINDASMMVASSAEEMSMVTLEVKQSSDTQTSEVQHAAVAVNEMSATAHEIARNASSAADSVSEVDVQLKEGVEVSQEAREEIEQLTHEVQDAANAIKELEKNSENIGQVLDAIQNVAEQTNLLALNAAIEAARAGEQGRGFAVVADEVRTLAQRTQESTETIRKTITEFQQGTNQVVATVSNSNQRAESGIAKVTRSSEILTDISTMVSQINDMNIQIAAAAEEQGATAEEISSNVTRVSDLSEGTKAQTEQTSEASAELAQLGASLRDMVKAFKL
ncbi:methyl-accepting chemotaxis protein [Oceanicoccus sagamiensis]|uniref:Methyl-accepting chemotaxis protein n=1 Tax=Oceanicoccus sagamiensis TaxID=716816 RepID=A0A1X9NDZ6_9GAMM|nr:methyl-accepting chemotaxis protein [Oceanicoccus sagamiensis]ARN75371.1 hypothetical protein BST96_15380 [Oceanicoccus sagamiensis]